MPRLVVEYIETTKSVKKFERLHNRLLKIVKQLENFRMEFKELSRETIED